MWLECKKKEKKSTKDVNAYGITAPQWSFSLFALSLKKQ